MTREEIDVMWQRALHDSVKDGEQFTRYHFAELVTETEREACAKELLEANHREWQGLTKREFNECVDGLEDLEDCWTAIEAKLKEKNT